MAPSIKIHRAREQQVRGDPVVEVAQVAQFVGAGRQLFGNAPAARIGGTVAAPRDGRAVEQAVARPADRAHALMIGRGERHGGTDGAQLVGGVALVLANDMAGGGAQFVQQAVQESIEFAQAVGQETGADAGVPTPGPAIGDDRTFGERGEEGRAPGERCVRRR